MPRPAQPGEGSLPVAGLYVAAHGSGPDRGLYRFLNLDGRWRGELLAVVDGLAALSSHPSLPVVYGVSGTGTGLVHAWEVSSDGALALSELPTGGVEPCHVVVSPDAGMLVVTNYESGTLSIWRLADDGSLGGTAQLVQLTGSSSDPERQGAAHPHQVTFAEGLVYVVDLGADVVRVFRVSEPDSPAGALTPLLEVAAPRGTGPRHLVTLPSGEVAVSGELAGTVLTGRLDAPAGDWRQSPSSRGTRLSRPPRNYPGDIQRSADGRFVYVANRGYDTIATFAVGTDAPRRVGECDSLVRWPQHLLVTADDLLVAGRDSSLVVALPLRDGVAGEPRALFECAGAAWLLPIGGAEGRS